MDLFGDVFNWVDDDDSEKKLKVFKDEEHFQQVLETGDVKELIDLACCYDYHYGGGSTARAVPEGVDKEDRAVALWERAASFQCAEALVKLAWFVGNKKRIDLEEQVELYQRAADLNNSEALFKLADHYLRGWGVAKNPTKAAELLQRAADLGDTEAKSKVASYYGYLAEKDEARAVQLCEHGLELGNENAMFSLGMLYKNGTGVTRDFNRAVELWTTASDMGSSKAQEMMEEVKAAEKYKLESGNANARYSLGLCYDKGKGVLQNKELALIMYQHAVDLGSRDAMFKLARVYMSGSIVKQDKTKAIELYKRAIGREDEDDKTEEAWLELSGFGGTQIDAEEAVSLLKEQIRKDNDKEAMWMLGLCKEYGIGTKQDIEQAKDLYKKSKELGSSTGELFWSMGEGSKEKKRGEIIVTISSDLSTYSHEHLPEKFLLVAPWTSLSFKKYINIETTESLCNALSFNTTLTHMNLSRNILDDEAAEYLSEALKINSTLQKLDLGYNELGDSGIVALSEALMINTTLNCLDLRWNDGILTKGFSKLSEALKINNALTELILDGEFIGSEGTDYLCEALKTNTTLTRLDLWDNYIGRKGAEKLSEMLKVNTTLNSLDLRENKIDDEGAVYLSEALKINTTLTSLDLCWNIIGGEGAAKFGETLKTNTSLTYLSIMGIRRRLNYLFRNNNLDITEMLESLRYNTSLTELQLRDECEVEAAYPTPHLTYDKMKFEEVMKVNTTLTELEMKEEMPSLYAFMGY